MFGQINGLQNQQVVCREASQSFAGPHRLRCCDEPHSRPSLALWGNMDCVWRGRLFRASIPLLQQLSSGAS